MNQPLRYFVLFIFFNVQFYTVFAQVAYHFSRQDSAMVEKYNENYAIQKTLGNEKEASRFLNQIAMLYWEHNQFQAAIVYFERSVEINNRLGNENGIAMLNNNLAMIYADIGNYTKSEEYFLQTLAARRANNEKIGIISALINLSVVENNLKKYDAALKNLNEALDLAREMNDPQQMRSCYGMLSETYEKAGNQEQMLFYFNLYKTFHEMVQREEITKTREELENERLRAKLLETEKELNALELIALDVQIHEQEEVISDYDSTTNKLYEQFNKQELYIKVLQQESEIKQFQIEKEKLILAAEKAKRIRTIRNIIIFAVIVLLLWLLLYRAYRNKKNLVKELANQNWHVKMQREKISLQSDQIQKAFNEIEQKSKNIFSSINYAKLIQTSMMNREITLSEILPNSFIFYKPLDVVSGDFYWHGVVNEKIIVATVDCTGHGVPGAFMSMIGNNLMNQIIVNEQILQTDEILYKMNKGIVKALNQDFTKNLDGMDMQICIIDKTKKEVMFSGAKSSIVFVENEQLTVIKGGRFPVGGYNPKHIDIKYDKHIIPYNSDMQFYIFSDGFYDQFGGDDDRKYLFRFFKEFLLKIHNKTFSEQKQLLEKEHLRWRGERSQLDDMLIIGFNIE